MMLIAPSLRVTSLARLLLAAVLSLLAATSARSGVTFTEIGGLPGESRPGYPGSTAWLVSADGSKIIGNSSVFAPIAGAGRVCMPYRWTAAGLQFPTLPDGFFSAIAGCISSDGNRIAGRMDQTGKPPRAFRWDPSSSTSLTDLGDYPAKPGYTPKTLLPSGMSADGTVIVGTLTYADNNFPSSSDKDVQVVFRWRQSTGKIESLGNIPGARLVDRDPGSAEDGKQNVLISADGSTICGTSVKELGGGDLQYCGWRWREASKFELLPPVSGDLHTAIEDVNSNGNVIVGASALDDGSVIRPVRWLNGTPPPIPTALNIAGETRAFAVRVSDNGNTVAIQAWSTDDHTSRGDRLNAEDFDNPSQGRVYRWISGQSGPPVKLATPAGLPFAEVRGMSADGLVLVGECAGSPVTGDQLQPRTTRAVMWTGASQALTVLRTQAGCDEYNVNAVSANGAVIVGNFAVDSINACESYGTVACRWTTSGIEQVGESPLEFPTNTRIDCFAGGGLAMGGSAGKDEQTQSPPMKAFAWSSTGGLVTTPLPSGAVHAQVPAISADGGTAVVRNAIAPSGTSLSVWNTKTGSLTPLSKMSAFPTLTSMDAVAISSTGSLVAGSCFTQGSSGRVNERACRWSGSTATDLGMLPNLKTSTAKAMSDDGSAVFGECQDGPSKSRSFRWKANVMTDLGTLPGDTNADFMMANRDGSTAVCLSWSPSSSSYGRMFRWRNGAITEMKLTLPATAQVLEIETVAISDNGDCVAGYVIYTSSGQTFMKAFRWTPASGGRLIGDFRALSMNAIGSVITGTTAGPDVDDATYETAEAKIWTYVNGGAVTNLASMMQAQGADITNLHLNAAAISPDGLSIAGRHTQFEGEWDGDSTRYGGLLIRGLVPAAAPSAPTISSVSPVSGPAAGGTFITISGANLINTTSVSIDGVDAAVTAVTATSITAKTPAGTPGAAKSVVVNALGGQATKAAAFTYLPSPTITNISPATGPGAGSTLITITGTNFVPAATSVTVGGAAATNVVVATNGLSLTAKTPAGTAGPADVVVTCNGASATKTAGFTYSAPPTVSSFTPTAGPLAGGTTVTITGSNFVSGGTTVTIGGVAATNVTVTNSTQLTARTPAGTAGPRQVIVNNSFGSVTASSTFTYVAPPTIAAVSPTFGPIAGGTTITITGTGFMSGATTVTIGGVAATGVSVTNTTTLTAKTPAGTAGSKDVVVSTPGGAATKAGGLTYLAAPTIASILPNAGPLAGGTSIMVNGTGFTPASTMTIGGVAATNVVVAANGLSFTAKTPAGTLGAKDVVVTAAGGSATKTAGFTYMAAPTIGTISPIAGPLTGGTTIAITGTIFAAGATEVFVGGVAATNVAVATGGLSLTAKTPAGSAGAKEVVVKTPGGSATKPAGFTYMAAPTIATVTPNTGIVDGGTTITITGTNFVVGSTGVTIGGTAATLVSVTGTTSLTAKTPVGTAGLKDVAVSTPGGTVTKVGGFTYLTPPSITSVTPSAGPIAGGTTITLVGTGFVAGTTTVTVGGVAATSVSVSSATALTARTPAGSAGARDVKVSTPNGSATRTAAFTYMAAPTITLIAPSSGTVSGGTSIMIQGANLAGATVTVGGAAATSVSATATSITAKTPAGTVGAKNVVVTTAGGSATKVGGFTYTTPLTGGDPGMPGGSRGGADGPSDTTPPDGSQPIAVTMARCVELIQRSSAALPECADTPCAELPPATTAILEDSPTGPDLDGNGVPDLCQLRCGDLDMSAVVDMGDLAVLLSMFGEPPVLGIGDLDGDGEIGGSDVVELSKRLVAHAGARGAGSDPTR